MSQFSPYEKPSRKKKTYRKDDRELYDTIWANRPHFCEECGGPLGGYIRADGRPQAILFSHRHSKGSRADLRYDPKNINLLCPPCHHEWEFGERRKMDIFNGFE